MRRFFSSLNINFSELVINCRRSKNEACKFLREQNILPLRPFEHTNLNNDKKNCSALTWSGRRRGPRWSRGARRARARAGAAAAGAGGARARRPGPPAGRCPCWCPWCAACWSCAPLDLCNKSHATDVFTNIHYDLRLFVFNLCFWSKDFFCFFFVKILGWALVYFGVGMNLYGFRSYTKIFDWD